MDLEPDNSVYMYNTGVLYNIQHDYPESVQFLEKAIETSHENVYAYLALGDAYEKQEYLQKAIYVYRDLMSLNVNVQGLKEKLSELEQKVKKQKDTQTQEIALKAKQDADDATRALKEQRAADATQRAKDE